MMFPATRVLQQAHRALLADQVLDGRSVEAAHQEALTSLAAVMEAPIDEVRRQGRTLDAHLQQLATPSSRRAEAEAMLEQATGFFGCNIDGLRSHLLAFLCSHDLPSARAPEGLRGELRAAAPAPLDTSSKFALHFNAMIEHRAWGPMQAWVDGFRSSLGEAQALTPSLNHDLATLDAFISMGRQMKPGQWVSNETALFMQGANDRLSQAWAQSQPPR